MLSKIFQLDNISSTPETVCRKINMQHLQAVQNRGLRLIGLITRTDKIRTDLEIINFKSFMKHLPLELYAYAKLNRNSLFERLGTESLVDNRRVPKPVRILE